VKLNFRQGLARYQRDSSGNPTFLQKSSDGLHVNLVVAPTTTLIVFAHRDATYLVEEPKTVLSAWGPLPGINTKHLYWDVNALTGQLTRGFTTITPLYTSTAPNSPVFDQHWFSTVDQVMYVWNGRTWVEKIRCFAGTFTTNVTPAPLGSQAGINGDFEAGHILLDSYGQPLRQRNPADPPHVLARFVTSVSWLNVVNNSNTQTRVESKLMSGMASEEIGENSCVILQPGRRIALARSTDYTTRVAGIVLEGLNESEIGTIIESGVVKSDTWNWPDTAVNRPLFCGATGQLTLTPPGVGVSQQVGFVLDPNSIFVRIQSPIVLEDPGTIPIGPPPTSAPTANFTLTPATGTAPLTVNFTSTSEIGDTYEWDFENNGFWDGTGPVISHTYSTPGSYTVRHRVANTVGDDTEIKPNVVTVLPSVTDPINTNLEIIFGAPPEVFGGSAFGVQVISRNDGLLSASAASRIVIIRTSTGAPVEILNNGGATVTSTGAGTSGSPTLTTLTFPLIGLPSGDSAVSTITLRAPAGSMRVLLQASISSPEVDANLGDNTSTTEIRVRT
jgi:PKD repeat protein